MGYKFSRKFENLYISIWDLGEVLNQFYQFLTSNHIIIRKRCPFECNCTILFICNTKLLTVPRVTCTKFHPNNKIFTEIIAYLKRRLTDIRNSIHLVILLILNIIINIYLIY